MQTCAAAADRMRHVNPLRRCTVRIYRGFVGKSLASGSRLRSNRSRSKQEHPCQIYISSFEQSRETLENVTGEPALAAAGSGVRGLGSLFQACNMLGRTRRRALQPRWINGREKCFVSFNSLTLED